MDKITNSYQNWVREEVDSPAVTKAREAFFEKHFPQTAGPAPRSRLAISPSLKYALASCFALLIIVKIGLFGTAVHQTTEISSARRDVVSQSFSLQKKAPLAKEILPPAALVPGVEIKKLSSQMGPTVAYQKRFSDVQITVVWVFPKGV